MRRTPKPILIRSGSIDFLKVNADTWEWRDVYQRLLALSWSQFGACIIGIYLALNLVFAAIYALGGPCVAGMPPGSFLDGFFFSVQTLATVGYGHLYPQTLYGNIVTTVEIMTGMFLFAVTTGLIFVRFSRPAARILFSDSIVIGPFNGKPALMLRVGNLRQSTLVEAEFRVMFTRDEPILEDENGFRHFYNLKLAFDRLSTFPAALTLRHVIDEASPLFGVTPDVLEEGNATFVASLVGIETVIPASIQAQKHYSWREVKFGERFVEMYTPEGAGKLTVDFGRLHETEPFSSNSTEG
ncbi:MAG TPA: ion channel [Chthoniobacterales bacterium]|nr:ion channel [Chthoniobacterales bacterium]